LSVRSKRGISRCSAARSSESAGCGPGVTVAEIMGFELTNISCENLRGGTISA
jgi:hypothetical protein